MNGTTTLTPLTVHLRDHTRHLHDALDRSLPLMRPGLTRHEYQAFLAKMLSWLEPTETRLVAWLGGRFPVRSRAVLIRRDLTALGAGRQATEAAAAVPPLLESEAHAVGAFYVLEGSALGGRVISRHLQQTLGLTADTGTAYFAGDAGGTGVRWREVCALLDRYAPPSVPSVSEGAARTFVSLLAWLT
jgi:heme oxygenase